MVYLTLENILAIRDQIAEAYHDPFEIMSFNGLMSALAAPRRSAFGAEMFPTLAEKAGALVYGLIQNHPFWDGNKRIATAALRQFLSLNGATLVASDAEVKAFTTTIARGALRDGAIAVWVGNHMK
jgi:death on curing protein